MANGTILSTRSNNMFTPVHYYPGMNNLFVAAAQPEIPHNLVNSRPSVIMSS